jgi:hypothetical protein
MASVPDCSRTSKSSPPRRPRTANWFTGHRSARNIELYERAGHALTATVGARDGSVYLTKEKLPILVDEKS